VLDFRVVTNGDWSDYKSTLEGIDVALFFDVDQSNTTGQTRASSGTLPVNDIGAEYRLIVGNHGDVIDRWLPAPDSAWNNVGNVAYLNIAADTNTFEVGITLASIGNPSIFDVVAANVILNQGLWDWAPDAGHATYSPVIPPTVESSPTYNRLSGFTTTKATAIDNPFD
jgi:hypothetical protein